MAVISAERIFGLGVVGHAHDSGKMDSRMQCDTNIQDWNYSFGQQTHSGNGPFLAATI